jgi:predicted pyridoxine 5'-phosphate oxidase superfamily flavin-nucleotide-binding protein
MIITKIQKLLKNSAFIYAATSDLVGRPNVAPKFYLKMDKNFIYIIDYVIGRTWRNLKVNPRISLSIMDIGSLKGYQIYGTVELIDSGEAYNELLEEFEKKKISLSAKRIVEAVRRDKENESFEITFPDNVIIFKTKIEEMTEIGSTGEVKRENF